MSTMELPPLPVPITDFVGYANKQPSTQAGVTEAVRPFRDFESKLREIYAQYPGHAAATSNHLVPVFNSAPVTVRARDLPNEPPAEKDRYLLSLPDSLRRSHGSPALVDSLTKFRRNFNIFSESSLADLDWSNVCVAGSAVVTSLLPVDEPYNESKRTHRTYYHDKLAPASDVDLFLYGLDETQALEKIRQIEARVRDSILDETTTVRTKNAITIVSKYPTRHVQIVLRLYKSISEILTGFDVDCSCVAYDGRQVWASPRALAAYMTQVNSIDLTRRSPSYENRLSKYSRRGFEAYWPGLDRSRVDPTIYERSFSRVQGLARLLVLEKLPYPKDRDVYLAQRREERGRPRLPWNARNRHLLSGNLKDDQPDDVAEWIEEDDVSNYHTISIPYGPKYNAKKVEKLLFTKDLLLNAEWNKPKDREARLHRHPAFFGSFDDVIHDCCGSCPEPTSDEDLAALEGESKIYISGDLTFLKDNPGRQEIGSFNPITDNDWTEMAYIGNTTRLCQAIIDQDIEAVRHCFSSIDVVDVNRRDHTGRTPLHLAVMCSTPEIVQCLIDHGARLVSRLYNGMTALHLAAYRGEPRMVEALLETSGANERQEQLKEDAKREARRAAAGHGAEKADLTSEQIADTDSWDSDEDMGDDEGEKDNMTENSFVKIRSPTDASDAFAEDKSEPDVYDVNVLAWDSPLSPLHLAILGGHLDVIDLLIEGYGAAVLLPVKILDQYNPTSAKAAILTIALALELPLQEANQTVKRLLANGATLAQADLNHISALHYAVSNAKALILETLNSSDPIAFKKACNIVTVTGMWWSDPTVDTPLITAIRTGRADVADMLLASGAKTRVDLESFAQALKRQRPDTSTSSPEYVEKVYQRSVDQPIVLAFRMEMLDLVNKLIDGGEDVNTLPKEAYNFLDRRGLKDANRSLLDLARARIKSLDRFLDPLKYKELDQLEPLRNDEDYLSFDHGSYQYWTAYHDLLDAKVVRQYQVEHYEKEIGGLRPDQQEGLEEKKAAAQATLIQLQELERKLVEKGAKTFEEMYPDAKPRETPLLYPSSSNRDDSPYTTNISFKLSDLTPKNRDNYVKLFEAAWEGDADTVRRLCLSRVRPLRIAVEDRRGFSPFSIATLRGHYELAELIVEIATVQYQPDDKSERYRYTIQTERDCDDYSDYSGDSEATGQNDDVQVLAQIVNDTFTIDDVAALADNVQSKVSPASMISWPCQLARAIDDVVDEQEASKAFGGDVTPDAHLYDRSNESWAWFHAALENSGRSRRGSLVRYAIFTNNLRLLKFLIKIGNGLASQKEDDDSLKVAHIDKSDFEVAIGLGRVELIGEMIKSTGVGLPLRKMFQKSGIELAGKPKYYQGLTVHGKKRQDWAEAGRLGSHRKPQDTEEQIPLLTAIIEGDLEATEYFLSDAPLRRYLEFTETFKTDKHVQALAQAEGGVEAALNTWMSTRNNLALHMAVLSPPRRDGSQPTFDFLLKKMPESLETRSADGKTPLWLAFRVGRFYAAKKLIEAGARVMTKDDAGRNVLHALLDEIDHREHALLRSVLSMLDREVVTRLLLERCGGTQPTGMTPLAMFLNRIDIDAKTGWEESLKLILSYSDGKDLEKMDGAGDYPLHSLVRRGHLELVKFIVAYRPSLLHYENATGMTPSEVVTVSYLRRLIDHPPELVQTGKWSIVDKPAEEFVNQTGSTTREAAAAEADEAEESSTCHRRSAEWKMNRLMHYLLAEHPAKRKLVALQDANEVAKRLALQQQKKSLEEAKLRERVALGHPRRGPDSENRDEVLMYLDRAKKFTPWDRLGWRRKEAGENVEEVEKKYEEENRSRWRLKLLGNGSASESG
ncbi:hypothetical protein A1O3_01498 [Capronia epimyces CBS 606.96]|uniref:Ankyrin repeat protein n=1 Tax=Capronia epimyces CBS 606.96 TaxID=1182542 RepID=W9YJ85_9EURO|nr:uncharacterized protein A1O3_01498 [Capronia epimyces CBS 606.96]EXJ92942.1 hypothetical protein A1O3_01498 [Capronia epimyces CBS 606.96]